MSNVIRIGSGEPVDQSAAQESIVRILESALVQAKGGKFSALAITALQPGGIPHDWLAVEPEDVMALAGAVGNTLRRIQDAVVYE